MGVANLTRWGNNAAAKIAARQIFVFVIALAQAVRQLR
jgi:hypothetical protein